MASGLPAGRGLRDLSALGLASRSRSAEMLPTTPSSNVTLNRAPFSCTRSSSGHGSPGASGEGSLMAKTSAHHDARQDALVRAVEQGRANLGGDVDIGLGLRAVGGA